VNTPLVNSLRPGGVAVSINRVEAAEVDEMWSYVGKKQEPRGVALILSALSCSNADGLAEWA
jgi:hypothetical protein